MMAAKPKPGEQAKDFTAAKAAGPLQSAHDRTA